MRNISKILVITLLIFQRPSSAYAWGAKGHQLIVQMAFSLLNPAAQQRVMSILNGYPMNNAAVWMDSVRGQKIPEWAYMSGWHFLNMDPGQTYAQVASDHDVVYRLNEIIQEFQHPESISPDSLNIKLRIIFHLMGDITQPLHVGYAYDQGGNTVRVSTPVFNSPTNELHAVWDDIILLQDKISLRSSLAYYHKLTTAQIATIQAGSTQDWMMQARSYLPSVYNFRQIKNGVSPLPLSYLTKNAGIVQQQLVFAAIRLANALNTAFGGQS
jgi:hypothetical protein